MSTLTLIRHGQARAFQKESDELSSLGELQSRKLGEYWLSQHTTFDEVYTGPLVRQLHTADLVAASFEQAGVAWPAKTVLEELGEYDSKGILATLTPELARRNPAFRNLVDSFERAETDRNRHFQRMFEVVILEWLEGTIQSADVEPWPAFQERVCRAIRRITANGGSGRRIGVFTSGGPIGVAVQTALGAPDRAAVEVNWRVRNSSLTEFIFGGGRISLDTFNAIPHLDDPGLVTYR